METATKSGPELSSAFADAKGRQWRLAITVGDLIKVRKETGVDLAGALKSDAALADLMFGDPAGLVSTLYVLCEKQAGDMKVSPEEFGYGFDGPTVESATEALMTAIADFFPRSRIGRAIRQSMKRTMDRADEAGVLAINRADGLLTTSSSTPSS